MEEAVVIGPFRRHFFILSSLDFFGGPYTAIRQSISAFLSWCERAARGSSASYAARVLQALCIGARLEKFVVSSY